MQISYLIYFIVAGFSVLLLVGLVLLPRRRHDLAAC